MKKIVLELITANNHDIEIRNTNGTTLEDIENEAKKISQDYIDSFSDIRQVNWEIVEVLSRGSKNKT